LQLASLCLAKFGRPDELCILLPSPRIAVEARDFLADQSPPLSSRIVEFVICPSISLPSTSAPEVFSSQIAAVAGVDCIELQILLFDKAHWSTAKAFWQHTGGGISSRMAERALLFMGETPAGSSVSASAPPQERQGKNVHYYSKNRHYLRKQPSAPSTPALPQTPQVPQPPTRHVDETVADELLTPDLTTYLEERYGRNLPLFNASLAKQALKRRIAGGLLPSDEDYGKIEDVARGAGAGKKAVREEDVYLYPGGMSAIWHAHDICRKARRRTGEAEGKSVCYGCVEEP
jgi:cystathionine gamma-synthase